MKVLIIPSWYPEGKDKLIGIYHKEFCEALNKNNIESDMLYIDVQPLSHPFKFLLNKKFAIEQEKNYKVFKYKTLNLKSFSYDLHLKFYIKALDKAFKKYIKMNGLPDIIHAQVLFPAGYAATKIAQKYNIPVVISEHYSKFEDFFTKEQYKKYNDLIFKNSYYTAVSKWMQKIILKYTSQCDILPNLVNTHLFKNNIKRKIDGSFKILTISAFRKGKGINTALEAIKIINDSGINVEYNIIGDGYFLNEHKEQVSKLKIEDKVHFLGRKEKDEIPAIMEQNHALLISSEIETFAIPGIEALASGMPVISTSSKGPEEFIDKKCGEICKVNDALDMAEKIRYVYLNYSKYDKKYIEQKSSIYSEESVVKKALEIYKKVKGE